MFWVVLVTGSEAINSFFDFSDETYCWSQSESLRRLTCFQHVSAFLSLQCGVYICHFLFWDLIGSLTTTQIFNMMLKLKKTSHQPASIRLLLLL